VCDWTHPLLCTCPDSPGGRECPGVAEQSYPSSQSEPLLPPTQQSADAGHMLWVGSAELPANRPPHEQCAHLPGCGIIGETDN
jgi:hypothetical protein